MNLNQRLLDVYDCLFAAYGSQHWWPADTTLEIIVGAILTQSAAWPNVEKALANFKNAGALSARGLRQIKEEKLALLLYPVGYYKTKARKIKAFADMLFQRYEGDLDRLLAIPVVELRSLLLSTHGIGPETADAIILYASGQASFVIDAYTRRIFSRLGLGPAGDDYESWQGMFMANLQPNVQAFKEYHALIDRHAKSFCRKKPLCSPCPLLAFCPTGNLRSLSPSCNKNNRRASN